MIMTNPHTDRLDPLLKLFPVHARMFHGGTICGVTDFVAKPGAGQIHLVRSGSLSVVHEHHPDLRVDEPSVLLYPRPVPRRFVADATRGADLVCANLHFDGGSAHPIASALPDVVCVPLSDIKGAEPVLHLLFTEALGGDCGRHALVDRLFDVVLIQLLRHLMEASQVRSGLLAGMSNPKLRKAIVAIHEQPSSAWSLDALAETAGMSRSMFANDFRTTVGCTPGVYLQAWRIKLAKQGLANGHQLKMIAVEVGYGSEAALSRAFKAHCGRSPREWLSSHAEGRSRQD
jgi:AraC-like DNA-binding protein